LLSLARLAGSPDLAVTLLAASTTIFAVAGFGNQGVDRAEFEENLAPSAPNSANRHSPLLGRMARRCRLRNPLRWRCRLTDNTHPTETE
jgi:hypothetical protein